LMAVLALAPLVLAPGAQATGIVLSFQVKAVWSGVDCGQPGDDPGPTEVGICATSLKTVYTQPMQITFTWPDCSINPGCPVQTRTLQMNQVTTSEQDYIKITASANGACAVVKEGGVTQASDCT